MEERMKKGYRQLLDEANAQVVAVSAVDATTLHGDPGIVFVDLRDPREREREGTIPDAFSCPRGMLEFWIDPESPYAKPVFAEDRRFVFFCASGWRSALAAKTAEDMGLEKVSHVAGGFTAWRDAGGPVVTVGHKPKA
ncbi:rhodanese-like domain-containing protein [Rhizobium sp. PAMB 3182]